MKTDQRSPGFPWALWAATLVVGLLLFVANRLYPPPFEHSTPTLHFHDATIDVDFDAINHTHDPFTGTLRVSIGTVGTLRSLAGPTFRSQNYRAIPVSLAPAETRHLHCEFPNTSRTLPNTAEVILLP